MSDDFKRIVDVQEKQWEMDIRPNFLLFSHSFLRDCSKSTDMSTRLKSWKQ